MRTYPLDINYLLDMVSTARVLFVVGALPPIECGVGYYTSALLAHLESKPIQVSVITTLGCNKISEQSRMFYTKSWRIKNLPRLIKICKGARAGFIHMQYPSKGYGKQLGINILPWLLRIFVPGAHLAVSLHEYFGSPLLGRIRNLITILPAQSIIVSNEADRYALPKIARKKALVIPIGTDIETTQPDSLAANHYLENYLKKKPLLFFGFAFPSKRIELLISAMDHISDRGLIVASSLDEHNSYHQSLAKNIEAHNSRAGFEHIRVIGFQPNSVLVPLLQKSFCIVLPQTTPLNPKSSTLLAAVHYGLPAIGQKGESWENSPLIDSFNSILLNKVSGESISEAVSQLSDPALRRKITSNLRGLALRYAWEGIVESHIQLYKTL